MSDREARLERKSRETEIRAVVKIDGRGRTRIKTGIGLLDHMLDLFAFHGLFDLELEVVKADLDIDIHHTNEDIGIVLGKAFRAALGERRGIRRFGSAFAPMEATLGHSVVDLSGRGFLSFTVSKTDGSPEAGGGTQEGYSLSHLEHFLESFAHNLGATVNVAVSRPSEDLHTNVETVFKSLGLALDEASRIDPRRAQEVPSTKGIID